MKRYIITAVLIMLAVAITAGCDLLERTVTGSGEIVTQEEDFSDFNEVSASHNFDVNIKQGDGYEVVIRIDDNLLEYLDVTKRGNRLEIGIEDNLLVLKSTMEAEITMPAIEAVLLSGASDAQISGFNSDKDFTSDLSGASSLTGNIAGGDLVLDLSGASEVTLVGSGRNLDIDASGSSDIDLSDFPVEDADIALSGASSAIVYVNGTLDVNASGSSDVEYLGEPTLGSIDTSGSSTVSRH